MSENKKCSDLSLLKDNFTNIKNDFRPAAMLKIDSTDSSNISSLASVCKEFNFGAIVPFWTKKSVPAYGSDEYYDAYSSLLSSLKKEGMTAVFCDDCDFPSGWAGGELFEKHPEYTVESQLSVSMINILRNEYLSSILTEELGELSEDEKEKRGRSGSGVDEKGFFLYNNKVRNAF